MASDLRSLLTPELFAFMVEAWLDVSKTEPVDFHDAIRRILFSSNCDADALRTKAWPVLKALGEIALRYARQLQALPADLRPGSWTRWKDAAVSVDYFIWVRLWLGAPFVHHEATGDLAAAFSDETRAFVEDHFGVRDPLRDQPDRRWDLHGFPKMLASGGPSQQQQQTCGAADGSFWLMCLMDVHKPPLDRYGRYPYQNWRLGRVGTAEEDAWMEEAVRLAPSIFGPPSDEVVRKLRDDVEKGVWTPLGSGSE
ncbi:hypothetical protein F4778DRAFT_334433 [Xylariomycetidae sp. FL2044]|nr:hypothetical protein F4778DRAFT_334433 [Xylariomycetidae sp. FL2044]